jgi:ABC-type lipoprotein release transport system permease subunit
MGAVWVRAVSEVRERRRALLSAAILCGLFGAAALATFAGARRTEGAYPQFLERNKAYDLLVTDSSFFSDVFWKVDFDLLARRPYVKTAIPVMLGGLDLLDERGSPVEVLFLGSTDPRYGRDVNRPLVVEGRLADQSRPNEITVPLYGKGILAPLRTGQRVTAKVGDEALELTVVGRTVIPGEIPPEPQFSWPVGVTAAFIERYSDRVGFSLESMMLRFDRRSDAARFQRDAITFTGGKVLAPQEQESHARAVQGSTSLQASALTLLAGFTALTGLLIVGQVLARETTLGSEEMSTLRALGFDRRQLLRLGILRVMPVAILGGILAVGIAWLASPLFPRGSVAVVERHGFAFDPLVLGLGGPAIGVAVVLLVLVPAWRAAAAAGRPEPAAAHPSTVASLVAAAGASVPAVAGARLALERGRGRTAVPVFSSMVVVSLGIASFVAATTFAGSLQTMVDRRDFQGKSWDQVINTVTTDTDQSELPPLEIEQQVEVRARALAQDPDIEALALAESGVPLRVFSADGPERGIPVLGLAIVNVKGSLYCPIVEGRAPTGPDEVALGVRMIKALGLRLDPANPPTVEIALQGAEGRRAPLKVVGRAVIPPLGNFGELGYGIMLGNRDSATTLIDDPSSAPPITDLIVRWRDGADPDEVIGRFTDRFPDVRLGDDVSGGRFADVVSFGGVEGAPLAVGGVLAALGAAGLAHVLVTAIRRRRRDVAILKTIGFVRGQARRVVAWQATIIVIIACAAGVPLGVITGRALWNAVANGIGVLPRPQVEPVLLLALIPAVVALANLIAAPPGRSAARTQPAQVLRSE